jgi:hypothetical protein
MIKQTALNAVQEMYLTPVFRLHILEKQLSDYHRNWSSQQDYI